MDIIEGIKGRRSIREFKAEPLPQELFEELIGLASHAPSWKNSQTVRYLVLQDQALKTYLADHCVLGFEQNSGIFKKAPALILVTTLGKRSGYERDGSFTTSKGTHWESFDAGLATQTLCLSAYALGLGTVIMGIFDEEAIKAKLGIPQEQKLSAVVAIGYPAEEPQMPKRREVDQLLTLVD